MSYIRGFISGVWNGIKSVISSVVSGIKTTVTSRFNAIKSTATRIFNAVKDAMLKPINKARDLIKTAIDKIKGFFSGLSLKFPSISMPKLPKFSLTGSFSLKPPSVPKLSVSWNAQGGIFSRPTIFNTANAGMQGVGEASPEAIIPLTSKVLGGIGRGIAATMGNNDTRTSNSDDNGGTTEVVVPVILEGKEIARVTAPFMDRELARKQRAASRARGGF
jgi:phage-related protein